MTRRRLPIGIQTFRKIREENCYHVDKTTYIRELLDTGTHYFLSRPRRFGKSLFLDTLKELFEGSERLFVGLDIHGHWDWSKHYPVLRLSFGSGNFKEPGSLHASLMAQLKSRCYADKYRDLGQPIHLVAVEFSKGARNLAAFEVERA